MVANLRILGHRSWGQGPAQHLWVVDGASVFLAQEGIADRCKVVGGDMFTSVPEGGNLYFLSRVIHDWDDPRATDILRSCRRAMAPNACS
jgi:hypothetical protein